MKSSVDYRISKIEKGPLQRFKNQNLVLKKFGEMGLQVYKAITGKRTTEELRKDLDLDAEMFGGIIAYMKEAGMIELTAVGVAEQRDKIIDQLAETEEEDEEPGEEEPEEEKEEVSEEAKEEKPKEKKKRHVEEEISYDEIKPIDGGGKEVEEEVAEIKEEKSTEEEPEEEKPKEKKKRHVEEEISYDEIKPIDEGGEEPAKEEPEEEKEEEGRGEVSEEAKEEEEEIEAIEEEVEGKDEKGPVERIIEEKYGKVGLQVYTLIDGRRTAEQIMKETGLTEAKLVEILDFMDEQGIIKLEYPKDKKGGEATVAEEKPVAIEREEFAPMLEKEEAEEVLTSVVELPIRAPSDIVKGMQMKAKIMMKYSDKGSKLFDGVDGKNDVLDLALKLNMPLYEVDKIIKFLLQQRAIIIKPLTRNDVKKKYGDDGYSVYKKYGKEGLMLYELIGKEMSIKEMANRVSTNKQLVAEMFLFIHKVLGIDLPIDKEVLYKQLGV